MSKKKLYILKRSSGRVIAEVEAEERDVSAIQKGIEKCLSKMLGVDDYVVLTSTQKGGDY